MGTFGFVELQGAGDRVKNAGGHAAECATFELGVVLDAHSGEGGYLAATQSRHPPMNGLGQPGLLRSDLGSSRGQELTNFGAVVHRQRHYGPTGGLGCPISTPINSDFLGDLGCGFAENP